jgi:hypothetical protein
MMATPDISSAVIDNEITDPSETNRDQQNTNTEFNEDNIGDVGGTYYNDLECSIYQNYTASEVFVQGLAGIVNQQDVEAMIRAQKKM